MTCGIASRPGLRCLQDVIRAEGVVVAGESEQALSPREMLVASFERFLLVERGLAVGTVHGYVLAAVSSSGSALTVRLAESRQVW